MLCSAITVAEAAPTAAASSSDWGTHFTAAETTESAQHVIRSLVAAGRSDGLRWPDFADYSVQVAKVYAASRYTPIWVRDGLPTPQALQLIAALQDADHEGLRADDYDSYRWLERQTALQHPHSAATEARFDVALTVSAMRYVSDLHGTRPNAPAQKVHYVDARKDIELALYVRLWLAEAKDVNAELERLKPPLPVYGRLRDALVKYETFAKTDDGEPLPVPQGMGYPGPPYPGYSRLVRLLRLVGDLPPTYSTEVGQTQVYDAELLQGVRRFQSRHGLSASGYLDVATVEQMNVPLSFRVEQIRVALERLRQLRYDFRTPAIVVNIPEFRLYAFDKDGQARLQMRVDVGEEYDNRTPEMRATLNSVVFHPSWSIPTRIASQEWVPFLEMHRNFLASNDYELLTPDGQRVPAVINDQTLSGLRSGRLRIRQRPGDYNPMGSVKFVLPNPRGIYLHDIPSRDINFLVPDRLASHGCVHIEKPAELAAWVLKGQPGWNQDQVRAAMDRRGGEQAVKVANPVLVLIVYATAVARDNGEVNFFRDIYGYDASFKASLTRGYPAVSSYNLK